MVAIDVYVIVPSTSSLEKLKHTATQCMMKGLGLKTEMNLLFIIISLKLEIAELF